MPTLVLGSTSTYDGASKTAAELASALTGVSESGGNLVLEGGTKRIKFNNANATIVDDNVVKDISASTTVSTNTQELVIDSSVAGIFKTSVTINAGVYVWSDSTGTPALDIQVPDVTVSNSGYIIGRGGNGGQVQNNGTSGGAGLRVNVTGVSVTNASGAFIAGGGGGGAGGYNFASGGGGGAGGGSGGTGNFGLNPPGGAGGSIGQSGSNGTTGSNGAAGGGGGGSGGGSGSVVADGEGVSIGGGGGGGGGRILPGTGGSGSRAGGSAGNAGADGPSGAGDGPGAGGGGWGASGGNSRDGFGNNFGGSGGAAVSATQSYSLTNNGTIYGAT